MVFEWIFQSFLLNIFTLSQATHLSANLSFHLSNYDILIIVFTMWHTLDNTRDKICFYLQPVVKLTFWHVSLNKKWLYLQMKFWSLEALNLHIRLYLDNGFNIFFTKGYRCIILLKPYVKRLEIFCHANYLLYWTENELGYVEVCMNNLFNCTIWNVQHEIWFPCRCCVAIFSITDSFPHERNAWEVHDYLFRLS